MRRCWWWRSNDGVMPQTREHVQILQLLGIDRGVVALTKSDLAPARDAEVAAQVHALLQKTALPRRRCCRCPW